MNFCELSFPDNDSYAFRECPILTEFQRVQQEILPDMSGKSLPGVKRCVTCGELLAKWEEPLNGLVINIRRYDISCTYDGVDVVSKRFKTAYETTDLFGLEFCELPDDPEFFAIRPTKSVEFDAKRRGTQFENRCPVCNQYESVIGASPIYLRPGSEIGDREFVRTDLEFASNDEKSPLLLCGNFAAAALLGAKLKGLDFRRG